MGLYNDHILPRLIDWAMDTRDLREQREEVLKDLSGTVLEVGFGTGLNLPHYPKAVREVLAVDPSEVGRKLAAHRLQAADFHVNFVGLDGQSLPIPDQSVDYVVTTWTLCTIPVAQDALAEMRRVLRPGGKYYFIEHGKADNEKTCRWQNWLNPVHRLISGGCNLNRKIDEIVSGSGFELEGLDNFYMKGPRPYTYMYRGVAADGR